VYNFILKMFLIGKIDDVKVQSYCPTYITQDDVDAILATKGG